jgi:hypothetical protein
MKQLFDGSSVTSRSYYFLLDWNEQNNREYINQKFHKNRLCDLTKHEYKQLFEYAFEGDLNKM